MTLNDKNSSANRRTFLGAVGLAAIGLVTLRWPTRTFAATFPVRHSDAEWRKLLGGRRYAILRKAGTEVPFTSPLNQEHRKGTFVCAGCGQKLYSSATKFESGTGWPSFWKPLPGAIVTHADHKFGSLRLRQRPSASGRPELHRQAVHAVAQARRLRAVVEHVPKVPAATRAKHLRAFH